MLFVILDLFISSGSGALCPLSGKLLALFTLLLLNDGILLLTLPFNCVDTLLPLSFDSKLDLAVCLDCCKLFLLLFSLLLLFLLLKDLLELANGASVLFCELLELRAVLLVLFTLLGFLILVLFTHQFKHQLVSLLGCVIMDILAFLNDLGTARVAHQCHDSEWSVTRVVAFKDVNLRVLHHILQHFDVASVFRHQVQNVRSRRSFLNIMVCIIAEQTFYNVWVRVRGDQGQLQWSEILHFCFELPTLGG